MMRYRSDTWDSGNSQTRFYEEWYTCPICDGHKFTMDKKGNEEVCEYCKGNGCVCQVLPV